MLNFQLFRGRWWCHPCRCNSVPWQYTTKAAPHRCLPVTTFQVHPEHVCYPGSRRIGRGRGFPNSPTQWWTSGYGSNPWQTFMHAWTFLTTWTVSISVSIFRLPSILILWNLGFKWHSEFEDLMTTSSDEDIPALNDMGYWKKTVVRNEYLYSYEL